jgi:hypothetical protein
MTRATRGVVIGLLLLFGVQLWFVVMHGLGIRRYQPTLIAIAAIVAATKPLANLLASWLEKIRRPSDRAACVTATLIGFSATAFFYFQAVNQHRDFQLKYHDEFSYRIQTRMIAHGRLWEPAHPLAGFFESFQLIAEPVYASIYFPGAAMIYAPSIWLHLPHWVIPLILSGAIVALVYRVFTLVLDGLAGWVGALLAISIPIFREQSIMVMAQVPALFGELLLIYLWLRWRAGKQNWRACLMGVVAGWLAITRPVDALIIAIPIAIAMIVERRRGAAKTAIVAVACAIPFFAIQLILNYRVTGSLIHTPFDFYTEQVYPGGTYGFHGDAPTTRPSWPLPQIQQAYDGFAHDLLPNHTPAKKLRIWRDDYLPATFQTLLPHSLIMILLPVGLLALRRDRSIILATLPLFVLLYFPYVFFIVHYQLIVMPAVLLLAAMGIDVLSNVSPRFRGQVLTFIMLSISLLTISQWPQFNRLAEDERFHAEHLRTIDAKLASLPRGKSIVLFRFSPEAGSVEEPVYNPYVRYPDDAAIIRAHDRGEDNPRLYAYYAERQPQREVYLYDLGDDSLRELGNVVDLARQAR